MKILMSLFMVVLLISCSENDLQTILESTGSAVGNSLTDGQIIEGLKEALRVGTDSSISVLGVANGYFADEAVKILLPPEANTIISYIDDPDIGPILQGLGFADKMDNLILGVNRAAEWAVDSTGPIFYSAIFDSMTITDGLSILQGADTSATHYLKTNTFTSLSNLFYPYMDAALSTDFALGFTPKNLWTDITTSFNSAATTYNSGIAKTNLIGLTDLTPYNMVENTDLTSWVTGKGLNGVFLKVGEEEARIRNNPIARVTDILETVFGAVIDNTSAATAEIK